MRYLAVIITLFLVNQCHQKNQLIFGKWINTTDTSSAILITEKQLYRFYHNDTISSEQYELRGYSCDSAYLNKNVKDVDFIELGDGTCYELLGVTDSTLSIRHTSSGRVLVYNKAH
jgi:hypothetical protein